MTGNLGQTALRKRRRHGDTMRAYDALPPPLRQWLASAAMPWSPASCRLIWQRARARGDDIDSTIARLDRAEARTLSQERTGCRRFGTSGT